MSTCNKNHRYEEKFTELPYDQGGEGRYKCSGCAYERGLKLGREREENIIMDLDSLPESQAGNVRHKSPHSAFAKGYQDGVEESYR